MPGKRALTVSLITLLFAAPVAHGAGPGDGGLEAARASLDKEFKSLGNSIDDLKINAPQCDVRAFYLWSVGDKTVENLNAQNPGSDGVPRDVPSTVIFQRDRINKAVKASLAAINAAAAKAEESGDGSALPKLAAKQLKDLDAVIAAEIVQSRASIARSESQKRMPGAATAMADVKASANPNCKKFGAAITASDASNAKLLAGMEGFRKTIADYASSVNDWAGKVKKPAPPAPPPPPVQKPKPVDPPPPVAPPPPSAPPPPKVAPVKIEAAPRPAEDPPCVEAPPATTLPILGALQAVEAARVKEEKAGAEDEKKAVPLPPARPTNLQLEIYAEVKLGEPPAKNGVVPYDEARDLWTNSVAWKQYDREKRALGVEVAPRVTKEQFRAAAAKLGKPLDTVESRVRLQKALNELARRLGDSAPAPTVLQDGVLGSRTRNTLVYYSRKHPQALRNALRRQGFAPTLP